MFIRLTSNSLCLSLLYCSGVGSLQFDLRNSYTLNTPHATGSQITRLQWNPVHLTEMVSAGSKSDPLVCFWDVRGASPSSLAFSGRADPFELPSSSLSSCSECHDTSLESQAPRWSVPDHASSRRIVFGRVGPQGERDVL